MVHRPFRDSNPDLRHQMQFPTMPIEAIERELYQLLEPEQFKPIQAYHQVPEKLRRERLLTLPVMMAVVLSLVYRQVPSLSELLRVLAEEGLLWVEAMRVSKQALSKRLMQLPVRLFQGVFEQVQARIQARPLPDSTLPGWQLLREQFSALWIADGSTLEELRRNLKVQPQDKTVLGGKMMMVVEVLSHRPVCSWYTQVAKANDKLWCETLLERLPKGGLLIFDLGFFKFPWFDAFTEVGKCFLTRLREKTAYKVVCCLANAPLYRDEIIAMGQYRSNPCEHPVRLVSVLWGKTWYYYLTNVLDVEALSAQQVCDLYRRRWRIEDAFALTKRLLGLAYLWVSHSNGVEIQIYSTWIFYTVLNDLCAQVAITLRQPLEKISMEMVFRSLYHYAQALLRDPNTQLLPYLQAHARLFGLLKAERKRHRERDALSLLIWGTVPALS